MHLDILRQDLGYPARTLRRAPGFALTVVVVAALGVGATTAAFSITDHVLIRPLPFPHPERLVQLWQTERQEGYGQLELSPANYRDWQRRSTSFEAMGAFFKNSVNLVGGGDPERLRARDGDERGAAARSARAPLLGRSFTRAEDRRGGCRARWC